MNKLVSAAILSVWVSIWAQNASAGDFSGAFLSWGLFDAMTETKTQKQQEKEPEVLKASDVNAPKSHKQKPLHHKTTKAKAKVNYEVAQIVGDKFIFTTMWAIKSVKTNDCREQGKYRYYFSEEKDIVGVCEQNVSTISQQQVEKILALPKCKK